MSDEPLRYTTLTLTGTLSVRAVAPMAQIDLTGLSDDQIEAVLRGLGFTEDDEPWLAERAARRGDPAP